MRATVRLALIDDHELFRDALRATLGSHGFELVAQGADASSSFARIDEARPDVVLMDVALPGMDGITAARRILVQPSPPKVMMLSAYSTSSVVRSALDAGVDGYALKSLGMEELARGIRIVAGGERYVSPGLVVANLDGPLACLSERERDVFRLLVSGWTLREIAKALCVGEKTVDTHRNHIYRKLGVHSAVQLVRFAVINDVLIERTVGEELDRRRF
jgi:DNA-binding NarL/FixJ family response regulator